MTARRKATGLALAGIAPLALTVVTATPAAAHGSMSDPVSRVMACYAEGPESPKSAACKAAVQASGAQAFYDWNGVRDGNAGGQSKTKIPDGKLCSANSAEFKGLDLPRKDWPASAMKSGSHTFRYKATAPHRGSFELYITKRGYDPARPLKWSDLEAKPFAKVTDPKLTNGEYVFSGKVPQRSGRHLIYSIWQRSDSPEAFYTCSDVVFGKAGGTAGAGASSSTASAPTDSQIEAGRDKSSMDMSHHGTGTGHSEHSAPAAGTGADGPSEDKPAGAAGTHPDAALHPAHAGQHTGGKQLAETGGNASTAPLALVGGGVLAAGAAVIFATSRRRAARGR
ncbi:lytic polysaccharide monooxygenase auxiliary activity family 9 protein [Streptomyces chattanoogensis]|uniref:lytic polysaccharide monooxygenase auxiliary activity family 9 protein n=1 Tax=Streptomyces chattanoogensis TaxID=66876 RepID=UPI003680E1EC